MHQTSPKVQPLRAAIRLGYHRIREAISSLSDLPAAHLLPSILHSSTVFIAEKMHRSLRLEELSLLPISIRVRRLRRSLLNRSESHMLIQRFAIPAANGSAPDLDRLLHLVANDDLRYTQCLPVLYANLDPERIPGEENLNTDAVKCANSALHSLVTLAHAPKSTWPDLWPRIWAWIVFFEAYRECLVDPFARPHVRFDLVRFVCAFSDDETTKSDVHQTVGWRTLVIQAWSMILQSETPRAHYAFSDLCRAIGDMQVNTPAQFEEVLDGTEGADNLVSLVVQSITLFAHPEAINSDEDLVCLTDILLFLHYLGNEETIAPALMANGGATCITLAAYACYDPDYEAEHRSAQQMAVLLLCLLALNSVLSCHRAMEDALEAGLRNDSTY
ncbi:hypothetical protein C8R45DRAFT_1147535 [Mycena sanguinolenta]|nr:hypothetical protein C8R45DRAFT_1147535 [Mycena sanguinolenta]